VLRADVSLGPDNRSRGYGTVLLASAEDAGRAVDMFNGYEWQTRVLEVRLDRMGVDFSAEGMGMGVGGGVSVGGSSMQTLGGPQGSSMSMNPGQAAGMSATGAGSSILGLGHVTDEELAALYSGQVHDQTPCRNLFIGNVSTPFPFNPSRSALLCLHMSMFLACTTSNVSAYFALYYITASSRLFVLPSFSM
jgi:hypothetical protein